MDFGIPSLILSVPVIPTGFCVLALESRAHVQGVDGIAVRDDMVPPGTCIFSCHGCGELAHLGMLQGYLDGENDFEILNPDRDNRGKAPKAADRAIEGCGTRHTVGAPCHSGAYVRS